MPKNLDFLIFFSKKSVLHQFTWVDWPQQKLYKHQHLLNAARALFLNLKFPFIFGSSASLQLVSLLI